MQHTVAAVFDNYNEAQHALDDLVASGFSRDSVHLTQNADGTTGDGTATGTTLDTSERRGEHEGGIMGFFHRLFGGDDTSTTGDAELYSEAVRRGSYVLTVDVPDDDLVDKATDVLDRYHPVDIDERASQWRSGGWASQESLRASDTTDTLGGSVRDDSTTRSDFTGTTSDTISKNTLTGRDTSLTGSTDRTDDTLRDRTLSDTGETRSLPVIEEELRVGKRQIARGGVRIYQRVTEKPVHERVDLREEHVEVERRPVDKPATAADLSNLKEQSFEVRETAEEAVVDKKARVVEEVQVRKEATQRTEEINETVRRADVEVEKLSGTDRDLTDSTLRRDTGLTGDRDLAMRTNDTTMRTGTTGISSTTGTTGSGMGVMGTTETGGVGDYGGNAFGDTSVYRDHWQQTYGTSGGSFDDYVPAYQYGSGLRNDQRYSGRSWDDIESDVRNDWETRNAGGSTTWERVKAAVRHGWERITH